MGKPGSPGITETADVPVLIVGGGPAGLTTALELARRGVTGMLVERRDFTARYPRAHLLNVRTMETFADIGIAGQIYAEGPPEDKWHRVAWYTSLAGPTPLHGRRIGSLPAWGGGRDRPRYAQASPRRFANLPQSRVDAILWEQADRAWPGRVLAETELTGLAISDEGALAIVRDRTAGLVYQVRAQYVVAADGGRTCGGLLGVAMSGPQALIDMVSVYFTADLSRYADPEALLTYFIQPGADGGPVAGLVAMGPRPWGPQSPQWSLGMTIRQDDPIRHDTAALISRAKEVMGIPGLEMDVHAVSHWQYEGVVADRFRVGPVFLIGDAAHRHPPSGGLGLNTAVGDAANIGWKLAAVLAGQAGEGLLDTYEPERRQVAIRNVEHSLRNAGRHAPIGYAMGLKKGMTPAEGWAEIAVWAGDTREGERRRAATANAVAHNAEDYSQLNIEAGFCYETGALVPDGTPALESRDSAIEFTPSARPGAHVPHVWLDSAAGPVCPSDLVAPHGLTLFVDASDALAWRDAASGAAARAACPLTVVEVGGATLPDPRGEWAAACSTSLTGAVLVRPDRHVAWRAAVAPPDRAAVLADVVVAVMNDTPAPAMRPTDVMTGMARVTEAGEALRSGGTREPRLFTIADV
jgi:2,4-dichlorophenol 6-monooxygenase